METSIGFFGHTHFPIIYYLRNEKLDIVPLTENTRIKLDANTRYLINPGSIGQPRDKNPASSYIIFDSGKMEISFNRFTYDVTKTQKKIREAGLPELAGQPPGGGGLTAKEESHDKRGNQEFR